MFRVPANKIVIQREINLMTTAMWSSRRTARGGDGTSRARVKSKRNRMISHVELQTRSLSCNNWWSMKWIFFFFRVELMIGSSLWAEREFEPITRTKFHYRLTVRARERRWNLKINFQSADEKRKESWADASFDLSGCDLVSFYHSFFELIDSLDFFFLLPIDLWTLNRSTTVVVWSVIITAAGRRHGSSFAWFARKIH